MRDICLPDNSKLANLGPAAHAETGEITCVLCAETLSSTDAERIGACGRCGAIHALPQPAPQDDRPWPAMLPSHLAPGAALRERYRLVKLLGHGEHGVTLLAHHLYLDHACVVKLLPYRVSALSDPAVRRVRTEASAGFRVNHANVVRVFDCDVVEDMWYLVTEFVAGADLAARGSRRVPWRQVVRFALDATRGLSAIHRAGLVHRDIKPGNLLLGCDGALRIADLGEVGFRSDVPDPNEPRLAVRGSLAYTAPEAIHDPANSGPAVDLYALGASLFELITGAAPPCPSIYRVLLRPSERVPRWPATVTDLPSWLRDVVTRMLQPEPEKRPTSADELLALFETESSGAARPTGSAPDRASPRGIAVLPLRNQGPCEADSWLGQVIADHLSRRMAERPGVHLTDRDQFEAVLQRVEQRRGRPRTAHLLEAARLSGAATVVEGTFQRRDDEIEISVTVHEVGVRAAIPVAAVRGALAGLSDLELALATRLAALMGLAPDAAGETRHRAPLDAERRFVDARAAYLRGDYATATALAQEAVTLDPEFGEAIGFVGVCAARMGDYEQAATQHKRQLSLATARQDGRLMVEAHANRGTMHYFRGEYEAAAESLASAVRIAEQAGYAGDVALIRNNLGFALQQLGRPEEAESHFQQAIETHKRNGALTSLIGPYNGMGHVRSGAGRYDEARAFFLRALALAQESDDFVNLGVAYMNLGNCALQEGNFAASKRELATALNVLESTSFWNGLARVYEYMADLNLRQASWNEAARCARQRLQLAQRHQNRRIEIAARNQLAAAYRGAGRLRDAEACLAEAASTG